jgi:hypothetical protein
LFALLPFVLSFEYSITEQKSANHFLPDSLLFFGQSLNKTFNSAEHPIIKDSKDTSFAFVLNQLSLLKMTYVGYEDPIRRNNSLFYVIPKLLYFEMESTYIISLGPLPATGKCTFAVDIEDMEFKLAFKGKEIIPSFTAKFNIAVLKITNNMFHVKKRIQALTPYMKTYFNSITQKLFTTAIQEYYGRQYTDSNYYVSFKHLGGYTVVFSIMKDRD